MKNAAENLVGYEEFDLNEADDEGDHAQRLYAVTEGERHSDEEISDENERYRGDASSTSRSSSDLMSDISMSSSMSLPMSKWRAKLY